MDKNKKYVKADFPLYDSDKVPHLRLTESDVSKFVLLPGDPDRVELIGNLLDDYKIKASNREFKVGTGSYKEKQISVCSTGIGGPSTEIALLELMQLQSEHFLRIGGTAAIQEHIECGELIINTGSVRLGGTSEHYARKEYPAVSNYHLVQSLIESCEELGYKYHLGIGATSSSFYHAQGRNINTLNYSENIIEELQALNVLNLEMESETILTLASVMKKYAATLLVVHCNRVTNEWLVDYEESQLKLCRVALNAIYKYIKKGENLNE